MEPLKWRCRFPLLVSAPIYKGISEERIFPLIELSLIRNSNDPSQVMEYVAQQIEEKDEPVWKKPLPPHIPGFFIPPEELDGLEDED